MFSRVARHSAIRPLVLVPALALTVALAGCGGSNTGAVITVPNSVVAADLNGDGWPDVMVASAQVDETGLTQKPGLLKVSINAKNAGTFNAPVGYVSSSAPPSGLAVGDLSGTGSHDIVVANYNAGTLSLFKETSPTSGTYNAATTITVGGQPNDVQIADLNGDGLPDLIVADNTGRVQYLLQTSSGSFATPVNMPIANRGIAAAVGDLNGDGLPDIAVTSFDASGNNGLVTIYFQDPSHPGTFLSTPQTITTYGEPSQIRVVDVNQDGSPDIVIACQGLGSNANAEADSSTSAYAESLYGAMVILQNSGSPGTFATPVIYAGVEGNLSLAVGDLNNDGLPDLAMTSLYPEGTGYVIIMMQDPANPGVFLTASQQELSGSGQPDSIVIADVDHDGYPDLVVADSTDAVWYKNSSTTPGTFALQSEIGL